MLSAAKLVQESPILPKPRLQESDETVARFELQQNVNAFNSHTIQYCWDPCQISDLFIDSWHTFF